MGWNAGENNRSGTQHERKGPVAAQPRQTVKTSNQFVQQRSNGSYTGMELPGGSTRKVAAVSEYKIPGEPMLVRLTVVRPNPHANQLHMNGKGPPPVAPFAAFVPPKLSGGIQT